MYQNPTSPSPLKKQNNIIIYQHLQRLAKWFLKHVNSPSLRQENWHPFFTVLAYKNSIKSQLPSYSCFQCPFLTQFGQISSHRAVAIRTMELRRPAMESHQETTLCGRFVVTLHILDTRIILGCCSDALHTKKKRFGWF